MVINDRAIRGLVAGIIAGVVMAIINIILVQLGLSNLLYAHWASVYLMGYIDSSWLGLIVGQIGHILFAGFNGLIFTILIKEKDYYWLKGILWGLGVWFASNAVSVLFKTEPLLHKDVKTILSHAITAIIYGWLLAKIITGLNKNA